MDKEMTECSWQLEKTTDPEMRAVLMSLLEIDKLRAFHENHGLLGFRVAVEERKKRCFEHGWVDSACVDRVRDAYSPLPIIVTAVDRYVFSVIYFNS